MKNLLVRIGSVFVSLLFLVNLCLASAHVHEKDLVRHDCQVCQVAQQNRSNHLATPIVAPRFFSFYQYLETAVVVSSLKISSSSKKSQAPPIGFTHS